MNNLKQEKIKSLFEFFLILVSIYTIIIYKVNLLIFIHINYFLLYI